MPAAGEEKPKVSVDKRKKEKVYVKNHTSSQVIDQGWNSPQKKVSVPKGNAVVKKKFECELLH